MTATALNATPFVVALTTPGASGCPTPQKLSRTRMPARAVGAGYLLCDLSIASSQVDAAGDGLEVFWINTTSDPTQMVEIPTDGNRTLESDVDSSMRNAVMPLLGRDAVSGPTDEALPKPTLTNGQQRESLELLADRRMLPLVDPHNPNLMSVSRSI